MINPPTNRKPAQTHPGNRNDFIESPDFLKLISGIQCSRVIVNEMKFLVIFWSAAMAVDFSTNSVPIHWNCQAFVRNMSASTRRSDPAVIGFLIFCWRFDF